MPKFSANLTFLYTELDFLDRFAAAARDGFKAVEYLEPYAYPAEKIAAILRENNLVQGLFNMPVGNWQNGERGIACLPDRVEEFKASVDKAISYAKALGCKKVNCLAGIPQSGTPHEEAEITLVNNLKYAAEKLADADIMLVFEPINTRDIPGYFVSTSDHAERILNAAAAENLFIQYDIYHMQIMQGDLISTYDRLKTRIGHIQIADNPGRFEPGTGEINYSNVFAALDALGYSDFVGCEYKPKSGTTEGLSWMKPYLQG